MLWFVLALSIAIECPNGMVFQQCGPFCPQTCENVNAVCEGRCAEGCFCPFGQVQRNGRCIDPELCTGIKIALSTFFLYRA